MIFLAIDIVRVIHEMDHALLTRTCCPHTFILIDIPKNMASLIRGCLFFRLSRKIVSVTISGSNDKLQQTLSFLPSVGLANRTLRPHTKLNSIESLKIKLLSTNV
jgi:hypothetical protein